MKTITNVYFFNNGNVAVFDEKNEQIGELQKSFVELFCDFLVSKGYEPNGLKIKNQIGLDYVIFKTSDGYNWDVVNQNQGVEHE